MRPTRLRFSGVLEKGLVTIGAMAEAKPQQRWLGVATCVAAICLGGGLARLTEGSYEPAWISTITERLEANATIARIVPRREPARDLAATAPRPQEGAGLADTTLTATTPQSLSPANEATQIADLPDPGASHLANGLVMTGSTPHRLILFTFDDGPDPRTTPILLDHLDHLDIKAVFFLTGSRLVGPTPRQQEQAELAREIVRRGHLVGNHTYTHPQLPLLTYEDATYEIERSAEAIERAIGVKPFLLRPPGGSRSPRIDRLIASRGYTEMLWNLGTGDFQVRDAEEVVRTFGRVLDRQAEETPDRGGIVLMHDTHPWTVAAFPAIVQELRRRNCKLLEEGGELYDIVDDPALFFESRGERDPSLTARPATLEPKKLEARQAELRKLTRAQCSVLASR